MSAYTKTTNFTAKDALISGNPSKIVKGSEIDDEFTAIETAVNSKSNTASPTFTGTVTIPTAAITNFTFGGTAITSTAAELNVLDGITSTVTELNYTDGVTSSIQTQLDAKAPLISAVLVTPNLGTPSAGTLTNATGLPIVAGTTGTLSQARGGTGVTTASNGQLLIGNGSGFTAATLTGGSGITVTNGAGSIGISFTGPGSGDALTTNPLSQFAATTSSQLAGVISDETGSGALVFATSPTLVTPILGTPTSATLTNATGLPAAGVVGTAAIIGANTFTGTQEWATGASIASATTVDLDAATGNRVHITGTTTITAVTLTRGPRTVIFDDILTLTHHATTNNLPGAADITTAAGDRAIYESDGATVYCVSYIKASGAAVVAATGGDSVFQFFTFS